MDDVRVSGPRDESNRDSRPETQIQDIRPTFCFLQQVAQGWEMAVVLKKELASTGGARVLQ